MIIISEHTIIHTSSTHMPLTFGQVEGPIIACSNVSDVSKVKSSECAEKILNPRRKSFQRNDRAHMSRLYTIRQILQMFRDWGKTSK